MGIFLQTRKFSPTAEEQCQEPVKFDITENLFNCFLDKIDEEFNFKDASDDDFQFNENYLYN